MKVIWRAVFSYLISMLVTNAMDALRRRAVTAASGPSSRIRPEKADSNAIDTQRCPRCGVFTTGPCDCAK